jgi:hypothetical protein
MRFSTFGVFHQTISSAPLLHGLSLLEYGFEFAEIFDYEIANFVVTVSMTPPINIDTADLADPTFTRLSFPLKGISF